MLKIGMSRKTRQQKIKADERHEGSRSTVHSNFFPSAVNGEPGVTADYSYVKRDLLKILLFTSLAIGAQVVLWYVHRK